MKKLNAIQDTQVQEFYREASLMMSLEEHENVVQVYGMCQRQGNLSMVMEFVPGGSLEKIISKRSLDEDEIIHLALGAARGLACLAAQGIVHRDIAARNILVGENMTAKIADFGCARVLIDADAAGKTASNIGYV